MRFYVKSENKNNRTHVSSDEVSDPETLIDAIPGYAQMFNELKDMRTFWEDVRAGGGKAGGDGPIKHLGRMPRLTYLAWIAEDPDIQWSKKKFFEKWDKHPQFHAYRRERRPSK